MHYHIDAWIWALNKQLNNTNSEDTRKFLEVCEEEKAEGCVFKGYTFVSKPTEDVVELDTLMNEWTNIYYQGSQEGIAKYKRQLKKEVGHNEGVGGMISSNPPHNFTQRPTETQEHLGSPMQSKLYPIYLTAEQVHRLQETLENMYIEENWQDEFDYNVIGILSEELAEAHLSILADKFSTNPPDLKKPHYFGAWNDYITTVPKPPEANS